MAVWAERSIQIPSPSWGGLGWGAFAKPIIGDAKDRLRNAFRIFEHVAVPESQSEKALALKPRVATCVAIWPDTDRVLVTVELDDQLRFEACEIGNISPNRHLAAKVALRKRQITQQAPQLAFGRRGISSKLSCAFGCRRNPHPNPPHKGEGTSLWRWLRDIKYA